MSAAPRKPTPRRVPMGQPLPVAELMALAEMTPEAITEARREWERHASPTGRALLEAGTYEQPSGTTLRLG